MVFIFTDLNFSKLLPYSDDVLAISHFLHPYFIAFFKSFFDFDKLVLKILDLLFLLKTTPSAAK